MGIPLFFRHLVNNYDNIITSNNNIKNCQRLFLDLNCCIHYCAGEILKEGFEVLKQDFYEKKIIENIVKYIDTLIKYSNPTDLLYIAIDGPPPKAKMVQQRQRRFKSYFEKKKINELKKNYMEGYEESQTWDTNAITPGTKFMEKLNSHLHKVLVAKSKQLGLKIILSDSNVPGEGEHKILDYIRENKEEKMIDAIYGLDGDLIMLCIITGKEKVFLLRESIEFGNKIHVDGYKFLYLSIGNLTKNLIGEILERLNTNYLTEVEKRNILNDYIFLSFLLGNDFIPHSSSISIRNSGIDLLFDIYTRYYNDHKYNLVDINTKKINTEFLMFIFRDIGLMEDNLMETYLKKRNRWKFGGKTYDNDYEKHYDIFNRYPLLNRESEIKIDQGNEGWRHRYYQELFRFNTENNYEIDKLCYYFLEALVWNFHYYNFGCISWDWSFDFSHPPSYYDLYLYMEKYVPNINNITFNSNKKIKPFEQLLMVLPSQSKNLLPDAVGKFMTNTDSPIIDYYPIKYGLDTFNKNYLWECPPKIPRLDINRIRTIVNNNMSNINNEENKRNKLSKIKVFEK